MTQLVNSTQLSPRQSFLLRSSVHVHASSLRDSYVIYIGGFKGRAAGPSHVTVIKKHKSILKCTKYIIFVANNHKFAGKRV